MDRPNQTKTKMNLKEIKTKMNAEADRYTTKARDIAYDLLQNPQRADAEAKKRLALDHTIRAEVFRTAANLCNP
jgi:hypothetical protein